MARRIQYRFGLMGLCAILLALPACQTPAQPRGWADEFTGAEGLYVYASRQSGGYDVRFLVSDADPEHVHIRARTTRRPIHGQRAYFLIDGERRAIPMQVSSHAELARATRTHGGVGVTGGGGPGFHTGVGLSIGHSPPRIISYAHAKMPIDLARDLIAADEVRFRFGEAGGPRHTLSEQTRQRIANLIDEHRVARATVDEAGADAGGHGDADAVEREGSPQAP